MSFLKIGIDRFEQFNDSIDPLDDDKYLAFVAAIIEGKLNRPLDFAGRTGVGEFTTVLPDTDQKGAHTVAENIRKEVEDLAIAHQKKWVSGVLTVSIGVCHVIPDHRTELDSLLYQADLALLKAKNAGENRVCNNLDILTVSVNKAPIIENNIASPNLKLTLGVG